MFFLSAYRPSSGIFTSSVILFKTVMVTKPWLDSPCRHRELRILCEAPGEVLGLNSFILWLCQKDESHWSCFWWLLSLMKSL